MKNRGIQLPNCRCLRNGARHHFSYRLAGAPVQIPQLFHCNKFSLDDKLLTYNKMSGRGDLNPRFLGPEPSGLATIPLPGYPRIHPWIHPGL